MKTYLEEIRKNRPLIHHITNEVTMRDCANICLSLGGSPVMAMDPRESEEVTSYAQALVINIGLLNEDKKLAIKKSISMANKKAIPVILDPVGVSLSKYRREFIKDLLENLKIDIIKGNHDEIKVLSGFEVKNKSLESIEGFEKASDHSLRLARSYETIVVATGEIDLVASNQGQAYLEGGSRLFRDITGGGCMLNTIIGCFASVSKNRLDGTIKALEYMNQVGELAEGKVASLSIGSFLSEIFNTSYQLSKSLTNLE